MLPYNLEQRGKGLLWVDVTLYKTAVSLFETPVLRSLKRLRLHPKRSFFGCNNLQVCRKNPSSLKEILTVVLESPSSHNIMPEETEDQIKVEEPTTEEASEPTTSKRKRKRKRKKKDAERKTKATTTVKKTQLQLRRRMRKPKK